MRKLNEVLGGACDVGRGGRFLLLEFPHCMFIGPK
jgi:hypothetical protein